MADILLSFGVATSDADVSEIQKGLEKIITKIEKNPPKVRVGLTVDDDAIKHFKKQLEAILNTVSLANGAPITLNISGLGEISAQASEAADAMKRAAGATKQHGSALTSVLNSYREMHALMRRNQNATDETTESYKGVRAQANLFIDALKLSQNESIDIEVAFARMGTSIDAAIKNATDSMAKLKAEMEHTGQLGTVTAKQLYDTVAKMHEAVNKNQNAAGLDSYKAISEPLEDWEAAADLVRQGGATVEQALAQIGNSSESASTKIANMSTALSSLNEEMKRTGTTGTTTQKATGANLVDTMREMETLLNKNQNASHLPEYKELSKQLDVFKSNIYDSSGAMRSMSDIVAQFGTTADDSITTAKERMSAFKAEMEHTGTAGTTTLTSLKQLAGQMSDIINQQTANPTNGTSQAFDELLAKYNQLQAVIQSITTDTSMGEVLNGIGVSATQAFEQAKEAVTGFKAVAAGATDELTDASAQIRRLDTLINQVESNLGKWTKARSGKSSESYRAIEQELEALKQMRAQIASTGTAMNGFTGAVSASTANIQKHSTAIKDAEEDTKSFADKFGGLAAKFGSWLTVSQAMMAALRTIKKMVSMVIELDTSMTELKKVTDETDATYERFLSNASSRAKELGASLTDVVDATTTFARLGYSVDEASTLADVALLYKNIGDGIDDVNTASESIISTMKAFGIEASRAMSIVDKFNEVGNNFAITSAGLGEALQRSAAAMYAAGNTLDQTIALATAANTIVQNPETVGTSLKTVSMYLRAAKTEAEEAGESTEGMAGSVSELRDEILKLTGNKVDIQIDNDNFKSTYQILKELSEVWDGLSDVSQANILEMIGGKRNANIVSALLENFSIAEDTLKSSLNSAGSAMEENEKYLESIAGKISQFKAAWQDLSNTFVNSDLVKRIVDLGTALLNAVKWINEALGGLGKAMVTIGGVVAAYNKFEKFHKLLDGIGTSLKNFVGGAKRRPFEYAHYTVVVTLNESHCGKAVYSK